ncbi:MAG: Rrf2 family transcriptional regulator [Ruthenibacterium sp.]
MHITQETDYAVRIVYCLAKCGVRRDARSISEEMCISLRFSLKILGKLVTSGIVESYKGNRGGYELARSAAEITLKDVINAVEGPYRLSRCVGEDAIEGCCNRGMSGCCTFQKVFSDISEEINVRLAGVNFEQVLRQEAEAKQNP